MRDPRFRLVSRWTVAAPPREVHHALLDFAAMPRWWPGVHEVEVEVPRRRARFEVRGLLPVTLRFGLQVLQAQEPELIRCAVSGHLEGQGRWTIAPRDHGAAARLSWDVRLAHPLLRWVAWPLRPLLRASHAHVMRAGERQLEAHLHAQRTHPAP